MELVLHPVVLLGITDHSQRAVAYRGCRVVGILLGKKEGKRIIATGSYALPFEEQMQDSKIWFLDHTYHEDMAALFKKMNSREKVVGWYHTGKKLQDNDSEIHRIISQYATEPVLCIFDELRPQEEEPFTSFTFAERMEGTGKKTVFTHIPTFVEGEEAEEIGVEHFQRQTKKAQGGTLSQGLEAKKLALETFVDTLNRMALYVSEILQGKQRADQELLHAIQEIVTLSFLSTSKEASSSRTQLEGTTTVYVGYLIKLVVNLQKILYDKEKEAYNKTEKTIAQ